MISHLKTTFNASVPPLCSAVWDLPARQQASLSDAASECICTGCDVSDCQTWRGSHPDQNELHRRWDVCNDYTECKKENLLNCDVFIHRLSSDSSCCSLSVHYAQSISVWTSHRKSSAQAGCHCSLHSPGAQWETFHLYKQPSGTIGKKWWAHHMIPVLT